MSASTKPRLIKIWSTRPRPSRTSRSGPPTVGAVVTVTSPAPPAGPDKD